MNNSKSAKKIHYFFAGVGLLLMGLVIVKFFNNSFSRPTLGDYLVVLFQYCVLRVAGNWSIIRCALIVLFFSYVIEILQFFNILDLIGIKQSLATDITLGSTFDWFDMLAYTVAFITILLVERYILKQNLG
ncbi:MAG: hypothetical protein ACI8XB_001601 [Patiriisocius sp.]